MKWVFFTVATLLLLVLVSGASGIGRAPAAMLVGVYPAAAQGPSLVLLREQEPPFPPPAPGPAEVQPPQPSTAVTESPSPAEASRAPSVVPDPAPSAKPSATPEQLAAVELPASAEPTPHLCYRVGPLSEAAGDQLVTAMQGRGEVAARQIERPASIRGYWVLESPRTSRTQAVERVRELRESGTDSFVLTEGELENAISLGLFDSETAAQRAAARLSRAGITVEVVPRIGDVGRQWLTVAVAGEGFPPEGLLEGLKNASADPEAPTAEEVACP